jgi:hypothetical protein
MDIWSDGNGFRVSGSTHAHTDKKSSNGNTFGYVDIAYTNRNFACNGHTGVVGRWPILEEAFDKNNGSTHALVPFEHDDDQQYLCDVRVGIDVGCGMGAVGTELWDVGCEMWDVGCEMWDVGCEMWDGGVHTDEKF